MQRPVRHVLLVQRVHGGAHLPEEVARFAFRVDGQPARNELGQNERVFEIFLHENGLRIVAHFSRVVR